MATSKDQKVAVGYVRVSTKDQAADGVSLAQQRDRINQYAALHELRLAKVCADEGLSGKRADNRPGLQAALDTVMRHRGVLVVYSLSRLARSTHDAIDLVGRLERGGADLASITEKLPALRSGRFTAFSVSGRMACLTTPAPWLRRGSPRTRGGVLPRRP